MVDFTDFKSFQAIIWFIKIIELTGNPIILKNFIFGVLETIFLIISLKSKLL